MGVVTPSVDGKSVEYTSSGFSFTSTGGKSRLGFSSSIATAVWDNIVITQGGVSIEENFNNGTWDPALFEVTVGSADASASIGSYTSGTTSRGVLRTKNDYVATSLNPVYVEATLYTPNGLNINFFTFRGEGESNGGNGEPTDAINLRIHNFWNVGIDYRPDANHYQPGNSWFTSHPIRMALVDRGSNLGYTVTFTQQPLPTASSATYNQSTGELIVTGENLIATSGSANDIDASKIAFRGKNGSTYALASTASVDILTSSEFRVLLSQADRGQVQNLLDRDGLLSSDGSAYAIELADNWSTGSVTSANISDNANNPLTVSNTPAAPVSTSSDSSDTSSDSSDTNGGVSTPTSSPATPPIPADPAPASSNVQTSDADGDGLREVITASDGKTVDGNRDGIADYLQTEVVGLRLIINGELGSDYGALTTTPGTTLSNVDLVTPNADGTLTITGRDGTVGNFLLPPGIESAFAGVVQFDVAGLTPGESTNVLIHLAPGTTRTKSDFTTDANGNRIESFVATDGSTQHAFVDGQTREGNAYLRYNYATNRFEEYVDANGTPLYSYVDSDGDGVFDQLRLTVVDGDPAWDGDGVANGRVVDPGFLGTGQRNLNGTKRRDSLIGNVLGNEIRGKAGKDRLYGDLGADFITGGKDTDRIIYYSADESTASQADTVKFGKKDRFQFRSFDGDSLTEGQQSLRYIGKKAFSGAASELRFTGSGLQADTTGDGQADFVVNFAKATPWFSEANILL